MAVGKGAAPLSIQAVQGRVAKPLPTPPPLAEEVGER